MGELVKSCNNIIDGLYLSMVARLAEPGTQEVVNSKQDDATNLPSLTRAMSSVNMSSAESLLS